MNTPHVAVRALNEYRRISPFTYLGLRYLLRSSAARSERWANEISPEVCRLQDEEAYWPCQQYKQVGAKGRIEFRSVYFPGANEALAESALLTACAEAKGPFIVPEEVFSYRLPPAGSTEGCFVSYFRLFAERHAAIGKACRRWPNHIVLYTDIKSYYPSVTPGRAKTAWRNACLESQLDRRWRILGEHLLEGYKSVQEGLLVGPMFSHLLGNLFLREFDRKMSDHFRGRYFRYVDDFALVIPAERIRATVSFIREQLRPLGLKLNSSKIYHLSAREWYEGAPHLGTKSEDRRWMQFIDQVKCYLMANPGDEAELARVFREENVRIALPKYQTAVKDREYLERFERRLASRRFKRFITKLTTAGLAAHARDLGPQYKVESEQVLEAFGKAQGMKKKWLGSHLKSLIGRLISLAPEDDFSALARRFGATGEFAEFHATFDALAKRDVSKLIGYSGKICAAVGQALATTKASVRCEPDRWNKEAIEGFLTLKLFGVNIRSELPKRVAQTGPMRIVSGSYEPGEWAQITTPFFQELAALAGKSTLEQHQSLMDSPLDPDERWVLFADELRGTSP